jgi:methylated-DNA-protein-cysteine methyltransferase-like protein
VKAAVYRLVRRIPRGRVLTYGEIAARVGRPGGARAVGQAMRACPSELPWHRVVNARGGISARARQSGMVTQRIRLEQEGVAFRAGRVVLARHRWREGAPARIANGACEASRSPGRLRGRVARIARGAWS